MKLKGVRIMKLKEVRIMKLKGVRIMKLKKRGSESRKRQKEKGQDHGGDRIMELTERE